MKIVLEEQEALDCMHSVLCNGALSEFSGYSINLDYKSEDYEKAKEMLFASGDKVDQGRVCFEDVLIQILKNRDALYFVDFEDVDEEEDDDEKLAACIEYLKQEDYSGNCRKLTLASLLVDVQKVPAKDIIDLLEGNDDACTGDSFLQHVLYGERIFS